MSSTLLTRPASHAATNTTKPADATVTRVDLALAGVITAVSAAMATGLDAEHAPSLWIAAGLWAVLTAVLTLTRLRPRRREEATDPVNNRGHSADNWLGRHTVPPTVHSPR